MTDDATSDLDVAEGDGDGFSSSSSPFRLGWVLAIGVVVLLPFLGSRDHWTAAEGRPAIIGRDMVETGRIQPPFLGDRPYLNKPPLYHGLSGLCFVVFGESEAAARLPALLAALGVVAVTFLLARDRLGPRGAFFAGLSLLAAHRFFTLGRSAELETLLALGIALAYLGISRGLAHEYHRWRWWLLAGVGMVVATWTKGPNIAPIFAAIYLVSELVVRRCHRPDQSLGLHFGMLLMPLGIIVATAVYFGPLLSDPTWRSMLLERAKFGNVLHQRGPLYYFEKLPLGWLPVILLVPWAGRPRDWFCPPLVAPVVAAATVVVAFSFSASKQSHYLLPIYPLLAIIVGAALDRLAERRSTKLVLATMGVMLAGLLAFDVVDGRRSNARRSPSAAMTRLAPVAQGRPIGALDRNPTALYYLGRRDVVLLFDVVDVEAFLTKHPRGVVLMERRQVVKIDAERDEPKKVVAEGGGRRNWVLVGR